MMRFILGTIIGTLITTFVFIAYPIWWADNGTEVYNVEPSSAIMEDREKEYPSIVIFYNPSEREHKKLHKWLKRHNIQHIHQKNKMIFD